ncbi:MAG: hypothetical protein L0312_20635, partial [Acidobacteria bacterium]|nr:hypothetical protein [Acidobacteriota bacterium]
ANQPYNGWPEIRNKPRERGWQPDQRLYASLQMDTTWAAPASNRLRRLLPVGTVRKCTNSTARRQTPK